MTEPKQDDNDQIVIDEEAKRKGDAGLLRALRTPPKPHRKGDGTAGAVPSGSQKPKRKKKDDPCD